MFKQWASFFKYHYTSLEKRLTFDIIRYLFEVSAEQNFIRPKAVKIWLHCSMLLECIGFEPQVRLCGFYVWFKKEVPFRHQKTMAHY